MFDGLFDDLIDIFSLHNLLEPLIAFFQDILNGPGTFFGVPSLAGFTKRQVKQLLEKNGIRVWGDMYDGDVLIFSVKEDQAKKAFRVLTVAEVPVLFPRLYEKL